MSFLCSIGFLAAILPGCAGPGDALAGYVEGEYTGLAPVATARVERINVQRGDRVAAGVLLAKLEDSDARLAVREAEAALAKVQAQLANLKRGKRPEEIAVIEATLESAKADARQASLALERKQELYDRKVISKAELDQAQAAFDVAAARVKEVEANLDVAKLPAREEEIHAMEQQVEEAASSLATARWQLGERSIFTKSPGRVFDILKRQGETAGPTQPVITFLPDGAIKLRFYAPQALRLSYQIGSRVEVSCDGCPAGVTARVSFIADEPEFTPPVIYSVESRQKLVYLIEARPEAGSVVLQPGQIVDVRLAP